MVQRPKRPRQTEFHFHVVHGIQIIANNVVHGMEIIANNLETHGDTLILINVSDLAIERGLLVQFAVHGENGLLVHLGHRTLNAHVK
jgi:hypothetical protein